MSTLDPSNCNSTLTLSTAIQALRLTTHNTSILCGTQVYRWSGTCAPMFLSPESGVVPGEESLRIPITGCIVTGLDKESVQIRCFLTVLGITADVSIGVAELTIFLAIYLSFHLSSSRISNGWLRPNRQNGWGLDLLTADPQKSEETVRCLWPVDHWQFSTEFLTPPSPFLNPIKITACPISFLSRFLW